MLALIPFAAMCFSVALWDRVQPMVLGLPFNLFWLICWIVLTTLCMWAAYRLEIRAGGTPDRTAGRMPALPGGKMPTPRTGGTPVPPGDNQRDDGSR